MTAKPALWMLSILNQVWHLLWAFKW